MKKIIEEIISNLPSNVESSLTPLYAQSQAALIPSLAYLEEATNSLLVLYDQTRQRRTQDLKLVGSKYIFEKSSEYVRIYKLQILDPPFVE